MKLAISGALYAHIVAFQQAIGAPKIEYFNSTHYGDGVDVLHIDLAAQNENGTNRDFSTYRPEYSWVTFSIVMKSDIIPLDESAAFSSIEDRMYKGLEKGFKRRKIPNFDWKSFLNDLKFYISGKTNSAEQGAAANP